MENQPNNRSSLDDPAVVDEIVVRLCAGESLRKICSSPDMPVSSTVYRRAAVDETFRARLANAREVQQDALTDQIIDMVDQATPEDWQVVRLRVWARQWYAAKLSPKKFGDKPDDDGGHQEMTINIKRAEKDGA